MYEKVGIHSGMGIFRRVAGNEMRDEEKKVVTVEEGEGGILLGLGLRSSLFPRFSTLVAILLNILNFGFFLSI